MFSRAVTVVVVREASRSAFRVPPIKFRHSSLTSSQDEGVPVIITSPVNHRDRKTQDADGNKKREKGGKVQRKQKSLIQPQAKREKGSLISEDFNTYSTNNAESSKQPQTKNGESLLTYDERNTSENYTTQLDKPWKMKSIATKYTTRSGTRFTTKTPSQLSEDALASMGIDVKGEIIFGIFPVLLALQVKRRKMHQLIYKSGSESISDKIQNILTIAEEQGVPITGLKPSQFKRIFRGDQVHQGVCCDASPLPFIALDEDNPEEQGKEEKKHLWGDEQQSSQVWRKKQGVDEQRSQQAKQEGKQPWEEKEERMHQRMGEQETQQAEERKYKQEEGDRYIQRAAKNQQGEGEQQRLQTGRNRQQKLWLYLDQIQDPMNFGAVLRSAYFMGVDRVLTSEIDSPRITSTVSKASAGVAEVFPVHQVKDAVRLASSLKQVGWELVSSASSSSTEGAGDDEDAGLTDVTTFCPKGNVLLIVGNEGKGISPELQQMCQTVLTITPGRSLHPHLQCLNVSVATALLLHGLLQSLSAHRP